MKYKLFLLVFLLLPLASAWTNTTFNNSLQSEKIDLVSQFKGVSNNYTLIDFDYSNYADGQNTLYINFTRRNNLSGGANLSWTGVTTRSSGGTAYCKNQTSGSFISLGTMFNLGIQNGSAVMPIDCLSNSTIETRFDISAPANCDFCTGVEYLREVDINTTYLYATTRYLSIPSNVTYLTKANINLSVADYLSFNESSNGGLDGGFTNPIIGEGAGDILSYFFAFHYSNSTTFYSEKIKVNIDSLAGTPPPTFNLKICLVSNLSATVCDSTLQTINNITTPSSTGEFNISFEKQLFQANVTYGLLFYYDADTDGNPDSWDPAGTSNRIRFAADFSPSMRLHHFGTAWTAPGGGLNDLLFYSSPENISVLVGDNLAWSYTGLFNVSNYKLPDLRNYVTNSLISKYLIGSNYIIPFTFVSFIQGSLNYSSMSFSNEGPIENSQTYRTSVNETEYQQFLLNISYDFSQYSSINGILYYGGQNYSSTNAGTSGNKIFNVTIDTPLNSNYSEVRSFYWTILMSNNTGVESYNSDTNTQNISSIFLNQCNTTYNISALNFTARDENNFTELNASVEAFFQFWMGSGTVKKNYTFSDTSETNSRFNFCIYPNIFSGNTTLKTNMDMAYTKTGYSDRTYFLRSAGLTNVTSLIPLPLLSSSLATKFTFTVKQSGVRLEDAIVTISKYYVANGTYQAIGTRETDELGQFVEYLELDEKYSFSIVRNGVLLGIITRSATCTAAPCEMELFVEDAPTDIFSGYYNDFAQNIAYNLSFNPNTKIVSLEYTDLTGLAQYVRLEVINLRLNESSPVICNTSLYSTAGTITCNITGYTGEFRANAYISRSPEKFIDYINFLVSTVTFELRKNGLWVALIILLLVVVAFWADVAVGLISIPIALIILRFTEFLPLSYATIGGIALLMFYLASKVSK